MTLYLLALPIDAENPTTLRPGTDQGDSRGEALNWEILAIWGVQSSPPQPWLPEVDRTLTHVPTFANLPGVVIPPESPKPLEHPRILLALKRSLERLLHRILKVASSTFVPARKGCLVPAAAAA
jgi:hypothetical protein